MNEYSKLMSSLLPKVSTESAEVELDDGSDTSRPSDTPLASNPDYKAQSVVMIEFPQGLRDNEEMRNLRASLESRGWKVSQRCSQYSTEDVSDGDSTGRPIPTEKEVMDNAIMNGVHNVYSDDELYKVVRLVRPEDTLPDSNSDIIYLMNGNGDVMDFLRNEGHLVVDEEDALHRMLLEDKDKSAV